MQTLPSPSLVRPVKRAVFEDIDAQAASLRDWNQRYEQLSAGRFRGELRQLAFDGVGLFIEDLHQSVHQTGCVRADALAFGVPIFFDGDVRFSGQKGTGNELHVFSGREGFEFQSPKRHVMLGIEVQRAVFEPLCGDAIDGGFLANTGHSQLLRVEASALRHLRGFAMALFSEKCVPSRTLRDELLVRLVAALSCPDGSRPLCMGRAAQLERRARALVMKRLDDPPTVGTLCEALGVSRRTLQSCFQSTWGMGPLVWLNTMRLNAVRRRLKSAPSVTEAATEYGFWHFGHFSHDFQALFGVRPSDMLAMNNRPRSSASAASLANNDCVKELS
jgi:AraC family ethanolamine operon transcriptional activator